MSEDDMTGMWYWFEELEEEEERERRFAEKERELEEREKEIEEDREAEEERRRLKAEESRMKEICRKCGKWDTPDCELKLRKPVSFLGYPLIVCSKWLTEKRLDELRAVCKRCEFYETPDCLVKKGLTPAIDLCSKYSETYWKIKFEGQENPLGLCKDCANWIHGPWTPECKANLGSNKEVKKCNSFRPRAQREKEKERQQKGKIEEEKSAKIEELRRMIRKLNGEIEELEEEMVSLLWSGYEVCERDILEEELKEKKTRRAVLIKLMRILRTES